MDSGLEYTALDTIFEFVNKESLTKPNDLKLCLPGKISKKENKLENRLK